MNYVIKKSCMLVLLASTGALYAIDDLIDDSDRNEIQQQSDKASQRFLESMTQGFSDLKSSVQETATGVAAWTQTKLEVAGKQLEKTKPFVKNAQAQLQKGLLAAKNVLNKGKKELEKIDIAQTKENLKGHVNQGLNSVQQSSKNLWKSFRAWFDGDSSDSFIQTVKGEDLVLIGGVTAIAAIVICGVTYVLYKSGVIKRVGTEVKNHPFASLSTAAAVTILSAAFIMYNAGKISIQ